MQLYDLKNSPFAARVRIQIRHKNLPVEIVPSPFALRTPEFKAAFPLAKVPILSVDENTLIAESTVIMDYLEDLFPTPALVPSDALARAHNATLIRYTDNHMSIGLTALFKELLAPSVQAENLKSALDTLANELDKLEKLLISQPDFKARDLQTGDICLATNFHFVLLLSEHFSGPDVFLERATVASWWAWVNEFSAVKSEIAVMDKAMQNFIQNLGNK